MLLKKSKISFMKLKINLKEQSRYLEVMRPRIYLKWLQQFYSVFINNLFQINRWFRGANESSMSSVLFGILLVLITFRLWIISCNARMDDNQDKGVSVWRYMRYWISNIMDEMQV